MSLSGPLLRLFEVRARHGCADELLDKFATTSAEVVQDEPGNIGYFFGRVVENEGDTLVFASLWADVRAVKNRFGEDWQMSFLPPGYEELIAECSVWHLDLSSGWHVGGAEQPPLPD